MAILQAIQAVSKYVLENEDEFISQLKAVWNDNKSKHTDLGQQELCHSLCGLVKLLLSKPQSEWQSLTL